eukprot:TRINITY_DN94348_c0_g1_i2.p1 TRINITY_DN94348_c0_g1~~TRINITY_DN94348_c0_g1_i2.p1  ORF type:complete len:557 (-),score=117.36 TRINITY_DN94348_c0_g1_i2:37-1707(-)
MGGCSSKKAITEDAYAPVTSVKGDDFQRFSEDPSLSRATSVATQPQDRESTAEPEDGSDSVHSDEDCDAKGRWIDETTEFSSRINTFILDTWGDIKQYYKLDKKKLGEGGFGSVHQGRSLETGSQCAIKKLSKARAKDTRTKLKSEIDVMKLTDHPNVVKLFETFEDRTHFYLVLELCCGGDLYRNLKELNGPYNEREGAIIMEQVLRPVLYLHDYAGICHRDLKLENFLFLRQAPVEENTLKLADFGLARSFEAGQVLTSKVGTMKYCSPQVLGGVYDNAADLWSCGVTMYILLAADPPFPGKNDAEVAQRVRKGNYAFKDAVWTNVSEDAKDLIRKLLKYQPHDRCTAAEALSHGWFRKLIPDRLEAAPVRPGLLGDLRVYCQQSKFKRAALRCIAMQLGEGDARIQKDFRALDQKGIGVLTEKDLEEICVQPAMAACQHELRQVISILRGNLAGDNVISFTDFLAATLDSRSCQQDGACRAAFRIFDRDGDGYVTRAELENILSSTSRQSRRLQPEVIASMLAEADQNRDGMVDYEEFKAFVGRGRPSSSWAS